MLQVKILCHQVNLQWNGLCLVELLAKGVPWKLHNSKDISKAIGSFPQPNGKVYFWRQHLHMPLNTAAELVPYYKLHPFWLVFTVLGGTYKVLEKKGND